MWGRRYGLDLQVYRDSVDFWRSGKDPYRATFTSHHLAFTYPPFALFVLAPLSWTSFATAQWFLGAASIAAGTGSTLLVLREAGIGPARRLCCSAFAWSCVSIILLEPVRTGVDYGQIESILTFLIVADLLLVRHQHRGILIGIAAAVKLTPMIFVLYFLVVKDFKSFIRTIISFLACDAMSWLFWPPLPHVYWFQDLLHPARIGTIAYAGNQSWYAILSRPPFSGRHVLPVWLLLSCAILVVGIYAAWQWANINQNIWAIMSVALTGLLISPISWSHHWIWVLLVPPALYGTKSQLPRLVQVLAWGLVALTIAAPYWLFRQGVLGTVADAMLPVWASVTLIGCVVAMHRKLMQRAGSAVPGELSRASTPAF
jgi:alpha-1,2-mannosyltransferase